MRLQSFGVIEPETTTFFFHNAEHRFVRPHRVNEIGLFPMGGRNIVPFGRGHGTPVHIQQAKRGRVDFVQETNQTL